MKTLDNIKKALENVKNISPLVHNITNYVTVNDCANAQLAIGGSPIMSDEAEDIKDITKICGALVINIGTLNLRTIEAMHVACETANKNDIPIVLDPVGCGASALRTNTALELLKQHKFAAIRGNLSEISCLAELKSNTKGVDSSDEDLIYDAETVAQAVAKKYGCAVGITGKIDTVSDGKRCFKIFNGNPAMKQITGTGCMISALTGVFLGAKSDGYTALSAAILIMGMAGERAYENSGTHGTGSLRVGIIDAMSSTTAAILDEKAKADEKNY